MNKQEFIRAVGNQAPPDIAGTPYLKVAIDLIPKSGNEYLRSQINTAIEYAGTLKLNFPPEKGKKKVRLNVTQQDLITSDYLLKQITLWVEQVRTDIFKSKAPPFPSDIKMAIGWIRAKSAEPLPEDIERKKSAFLSKVEEIKELWKKGEIIGSLTVSVKILRFPDLDENVAGGVAAEWHPELSRLTEAAKAISSATGFREYTVTAYILTGIKPLLPRVIMKVSTNWHRLPMGGHLNRNTIMLEINAADLTFNELKEIYNSYRSKLNIKKKKSLNSEQIKLYNLVGEKGGPPAKKGSKEFWNTILEEWNKATPKSKKLTSWEAVYLRYKLIKEKLESLYK